MTVHDLPDYTKQVTLRYEGGFIGLEEQAVRLGSVVPWDLRGNVVLMEDFESEEAEWSYTEVGTGSAISRTSLHRWSGDWSLELLTGDEVGAYTLAQRYIPANKATRLGLFSRLAFVASTSIIRVSLQYQVDTVIYYGELRYHPGTGVLEYMDDAGNYQVIAAIILATSPVTWWPLLLVIDCETGYYVKAIFGGQEYDLSAYLLMSSDGTGIAPNGMVGIENDAEGAVGGDMFVNDVVVVDNVP